MPTIKIFRAGTFTASSGHAITISENDLAATAFHYNNSKHKAPIVLGHPENDLPAYGWVDRLRVSYGFMLAEVGNLADSLVQAVRDGRYKHVSASFHGPQAKANPAPGAWFLKHVGVLGAVPPAVKGLGPVSFAEGFEVRQLIGMAELTEARVLAGAQGAFLPSRCETVTFACPAGLRADVGRLKLHQAALDYQHAHRVDYIEAVRAIVD
ncbi:MAG: hypothetical protein KGZ86_03065 [Candidatus Latescibacteria bacterium]|nr:hypothetical protein [Candidatus Latescibacterota bacterium]